MGTRWVAEPPETDGALLEDFGVRREVLQRQGVERRKELRTSGVFRRQQFEERFDDFEQRFGLFVAIYYNYQWTSGRLPEQRRNRRLWRWW